MRAISYDRTEIVYDVFGVGPPTLVFVHGWSCDRSYWSAQNALLSRNYRVVNLDLAGHGESGLSRTTWTIAGFGSDVAAVVSDLDTDSVVLIGHSMGGDVILEAARQLPGRVRGMIWVDSYTQLSNFPTVEQVRSRMAPFRANFVEETRAFVRRMFSSSADPSLVERVAADMSAAPPEIALAAMESAWTFGTVVPGILRDLGVPLVAINPEVPPTDMDSMHRNRVEVVLMSGVGHFLMMEDPAHFNECLTKVVKAFASSSSPRSDA
jgi:pimeloyl-ACP methyl ester carboxylesterase